ncbi:MAG: hypothetical protein GY761_09000, partial [Hyphomicrobiales bacterium]|nr:hypothetical protein [Hyphomicrobiales bacterium]
MQKIPVTDTRGIIVRALQKALDEDPNFIKLVIDLDDALGLKVLNDQLDELNDDELKSIDVDILEEFTHQIFELIENGKGRNGDDVIWEGGDAPPTDLDMLLTTKMLANTLLVS